MGTDQALNKRSEHAEVVELLPSAGYRLRLENEDTVVAHAAGSEVKNFMRLRPGDRVRVELSARDKTRGRIVELLAKL
jgi:translation initiation factor IF-1